MSYAEALTEFLTQSIEAKKALLESAEFMSGFEAAVADVVNSYKAGGRLYIAGNGGSAADSQHLAAEFVSKLARDRGPLPAEALTTDSSILTAIGNDYGYEQVFARQLDGKAESKDMFLAITTSGNSPNILAALELCSERGVKTVLFTGHQGGRAAALADHVLIVPGTETSTIQELHIVLAHTLCACVENEMFSNK